MCVQHDRAWSCGDDFQQGGSAVVKLLLTLVHYTQMRVLNREVRVILEGDHPTCLCPRVVVPQPPCINCVYNHLTDMKEQVWHTNSSAAAGVDKHDNLIGRLKYVGKDEQLIDLGEQLVDAGLAKVLMHRTMCWGDAGIHFVEFSSGLWGFFQRCSSALNFRQPSGA